MADYRTDPNVPMNDKRFTSDYGYARDITTSDKPSFTQQDVSPLHDTVSLNDIDRETGKTSTPQTYSNNFKVTSKNSALGLNNTPNSTLSKDGGLSSLYGNDPSTTYYKGRPDLI